MPFALWIAERRAYGRERAACEGAIAPIAHAYNDESSITAMRRVATARPRRSLFDGRAMRREEEQIDNQNDDDGFDRAHAAASKRVRPRGCGRVIGLSIEAGTSS